MQSLIHQTGAITMIDGRRSDDIFSYPSLFVMLFPEITISAEVVHLLAS